MAIVYKTTNLINNKMYIGVDGINDPAYLGSGKILKKAIVKYGKESFRKEVLGEFESIEEAYLYEKIIISELGAVSSDNYYNICEGGKGGWSHIDVSGTSNPMYGKSTKDIMIKKYGEEIGLEIYNKSRKEAGKKTSLVLSGKPKSDDHKRSLSLSKKDFWKSLSEEEKILRRLQMSKDMLNANITRNEEYKNKMSESIKNKSGQIHKIGKCDVCGREMNISNLSRWHGKNCKSK